MEKRIRNNNQIYFVNLSHVELDENGNKLYYFNYRKESDKEYYGIILQFRNKKWEEVIMSNKPLNDRFIQSIGKTAH